MNMVIFFFATYAIYHTYQTSKLEDIKNGSLNGLTVAVICFYITYHSFQLNFVISFYATIATAISLSALFSPKSNKTTLINYMTHSFENNNNYAQSQ